MSIQKKESNVTLGINNFAIQSVLFFRNISRVFGKNGACQACGIRGNMRVFLTPMDDDSEWGIFVNDVNLMQDEDDMKIVEIDEAPGAAFRALFVHLLSNPEWKARLVPVMSKMVTCCRRLNRIGRFTGKQTMVTHREHVKKMLVAAFDKSPDIETTPAFRERFHQLAEGIATFEVTDESKKGNTVLDAYMVANPYISNKDIKDNAYNAYNASLLQIGIDLKRKNDEYAAAHRESDRIENEKALKKETKKKEKAEKEKLRVAQEKYEIVLQGAPGICIFFC